MIELWKTGDVWYPDEEDIKDKPVRYTMNSLIEIASRTGTVNITNEHDKDIIGSMSNFIVKDGLLWADEPNNLDYKGKGFSPVFVYDLIEHDDCYEPTNIRMSEIGLTKTPRSKIVYNSINPNGDKKMENDVQLRQALDDNRKLQEEIGVLKSQNAKLRDSAKTKDDEIKTLKEQSSANDKKLEEYEDLVAIKEKYDGLISSKKDDLIHQLVGDDKEKAEKLKHYSVEDLQFQIELAKGDKQPKGVPPTDTDIDDGNKPNPKHKEKEEESVLGDLAEAYEEMYGEKPVI